MNGFRSELINKIVGFNAHAIVKPYDKSIDIKLEKEVLMSFYSNDGEAVILNKNNTKGILLKGYLEKNFKMLEIAKNNEFIGTNNLSGNSISIGQELSFNLNLDIGDTITVMSPSGVKTIVGSLPKQESFKIISIFDSGLSDYNENVAYINLESLENLFDKETELRFLEFYFKYPQKIEDHKITLMNLYPEQLVYTWADMNKSLFSALKVERNVMFIIL
ncbi:uncharacterized protein METZ01_LOCUS173414, partial [marine metagenome]